MSISPSDRKSARERALKNLAEMTLEEDAAITRAAEADPDNPPLDDDTLSRMRPSAEMAPETVVAAKRRRGERGPGKAPAKELVSLRLSPDVLGHFRAQGADWRARIEAVLEKAIRE
jgi:uncharacterized protein (DUF4415 family)